MIRRLACQLDVASKAAAAGKRAACRYELSQYSITKEQLTAPTTHHSALTFSIDQKRPASYHHVSRIRAI